MAAGFHEVVKLLSEAGLPTLPTEGTKQELASWTSALEPRSINSPRANASANVVLLSFIPPTVFFSEAGLPIVIHYPK